MITVLGTGWLQKDAWSAVVPGSGRRLLIWDVMVQEPAGEPTSWRCELEDEALAMKLEPKLIAGAGIVFQGALAGRPFVQDGITKGFVRFLRIQQVEFSRVPRGATAAEQTQPSAENDAA